VEFNSTFLLWRRSCLAEGRIDNYELVAETLPLNLDAGQKGNTKLYKAGYQQVLIWVESEME
jgi:hypothetical protein